MEENKEEIQWITKIRRHFNLRIEIYKRKKTIKQCKKEILQTTLQLGKVTYQCFLNQKESEEIAALSSYIQQRLATVAELEQQIQQLRQYPWRKNARSWKKNRISLMRCFNVGLGLISQRRKGTAGNCSKQNCLFILLYRTDYIRTECSLSFVEVKTGKKHRCRSGKGWITLLFLLELRLTKGVKFGGISEIV